MVSISKFHRQTEKGSSKVKLYLEHDSSTGWSSGKICPRLEAKTVIVERKDGMERGVRYGRWVGRGLG